MDWPVDTSVEHFLDCQLTLEGPEQCGWHVPRWFWAVHKGLDTDLGIRQSTVIPHCSCFKPLPSLLLLIDCQSINSFLPKVPHVCVVYYSNRWQARTSPSAWKVPNNLILGDSRKVDDGHA